MMYRSRNPQIIVMSAVQQISKAIHEDRMLIMNALAGHVITLPPALASKSRYYFYVTVAPTSNSNIIKVQNAIDVFKGQAAISLATGVGTLWPTAATSDTITANRTTSGGASDGEYYEFTDLAVGVWHVHVRLNGSGVLVTPFSATV